jgi:PAS domain S-box-containing protein/diguanylate cyclase (GGDEF)-like protein
VRVDGRRWWLLAATALAMSACAAAGAVPRLAPAGDAAVLAAGASCAAVLWAVGGRRERGLRGWRALALSPLFPVLGATAAAVLAPADPLDVLVLRWLLTVPGYALAIYGGLTLVEPGRLRSRGPRSAIELALFTLACLVAVQLLVIGPAGRWSDVDGPARAVLAAGVVVTSLTMAAALTVLGAIGSRRQSAALLLFAGAVLLTTGRGLGTQALLHDWDGGVALSRVGIVAGLAIVVLAVLVDPGSGGGSRPHTGASTRLGMVLPHLAMVVAMVVAAAGGLAGHRPSGLTVAGVVSCVVLAAAHRWVTAGEEQYLGARLRRSEAWFRSLVQSGGDAVVILDDDLRVTWSSPALERVLGAAAGALAGRPLLSAVHPEDAPALAAVLPRAGGGAGADGGLHLLRLADEDGSWRILEAGISDLRADASVGAVVLHCRDVTDRHTRERVLHSVAYSDPATGLPNRAGCTLVLQRALDEPGRPVTLLLLELDGLLEARERVGRDVVRDVLVEVGRRLRATVRGDDVVARLGGGAFAVVANGDEEGPRHATDVDQLAARCLGVVEQPIATASGVVDLTGVVGLAPVEPAGTVEDVFGRAELAVRAARVRATGTAARWTPALGEAAARRDRLRHDLAGAPERGELALLLDPIVSLAEQRVVGVEALVRWRHPVLGDVSPAEFVPLAERGGVAGDLGRWVLREAMAAVVALPDRARPVRLGVDVSTGWAAAGTLVADVEAALRDTGLAPERLVLEITEATVLADDERVGLDLTTLRLMGVHVALEGFGTGYSGLTNLTRLPIDILKLDRSLITRIDRDPQSRALAESMIGIGRALALDVVAEGVQTPAQLASLCGWGYGFAQGSVIARPMPAGDVAALLSDGIGELWPGLVGQR